MSDSVRSHRRQPTRLPNPWDSPGKNTGVGCHFLLQCMKVKSESDVTQLCPTLRDSKDSSPPGSSVHGIFQARGMEWGAIAFSSFLSREYPLAFVSKRICRTQHVMKCLIHCIMLTAAPPKTEDMAFDLKKSIICLVQ